MSTFFFRSDPVLSGESIRANQRNVFTQNGFSGWKKQWETVRNHEITNAHCMSVVARVLFLREKSVSANFIQQSEAEKMLRKACVLKNKTIVERIVEVVSFLGRQALPFREHRESVF